MASNSAKNILCYRQGYCQESFALFMATPLFRLCLDALDNLLLDHFHLQVLIHPPFRPCDMPHARWNNVMALPLWSLASSA